MKKTETKISSVRKINDPALSIVKIKRHLVSSKPKSNASKVNINLSRGLNTTSVFSLPVTIPEEGLKELNSSPQIKTKPVYFKPSKKNISQLIKNTKKGNDGAESTADGTSEYIYKLTSDIQAIEDKLSKVEDVLSKKKYNISTSQKTKANSVSFNTDAHKNQKVYNASDYVDDINIVTGYPSFYDRNSYSLELHNQIIRPLKNPEPLPLQYPIEFDPKAAVLAIRSELEQWRKENKQIYPTLSTASMLKNEASSCDLVTSISEENTVLRDVAEKDTPSSSEYSRSKFQEQVDQEKQIIEEKASVYPLDHYLDTEKIKNKGIPMFEQERQERAEQELEPQPFSRTEKLIKHINDLATEAEEKVKACIYNRAVIPSPVFSPVSLDESDSGYTEHLVETKFNEVTFQKPKVTERKLQEIRKDQLSHLRKPYINKSNNNLAKYGKDSNRSASETVSISHMSPKQIIRKKFNTKLDSSKHNPHYISKCSSLINIENRHFREELSEAISPKTICHYCSCTKGIDIGNHLKHLKSPYQKDRCQQKGNELSIDSNREEISATCKEKQYNDASVNTDPLLVRPNTNLVNVVSSKEEKSSNMNEYAKRLCQIQQLPLVVIRPNFTKQVGPIIDIKTSLPSSQKNNVAVVECIHGGTTVGIKQNAPVNIINESTIEAPSQTVSPPAVHFKNSRDLKLLKVTKDLLGKLNFKDGMNVERLKRSLSSLVTLLQQISPIHVASLRLSNLDAGSASESIDTFFSNIDLVTEIIETEIKKPTGRYCDYPECLIKAVDLLCGNIRSVFVIEDIQKRNSKQRVTNGPGEEKKKVKKFLVPRGRKQLSKTTEVSQKPYSVTSSIDTHETERNMAINSKENIPGNLYIPYRLLIPGGKHKAMEEAKNSREIELRFKRLEKVLEINENLKKAVPSKESIQTHNSVHSPIDDNSDIDAHVLNETFVVKSASEDDEDSEMVQEKKINKVDQDYEDDWEEVDSSKSYDGSMAMTEINVVAQVHSSGERSSLARSSSKKQFLPNQFPQVLSVSSKGSQTGTLTSVSEVSSQNPLQEKETKNTKRPSQQIPDKKKLHCELKDVETQYYIGKKDIATMHYEDISQNQKSKIEIIEPISTPPESGSFTVLRMTNASTNSLLEVRFPEQTERLQSSLTVQKTHNSEEVKLLYNLDKEDKLINQLDAKEDRLKPVPSDKAITKIESFQKDTPNNIEKVLSNCEQNIDDKSSLQKKEAINDFQNITTNFIHFLENKVTEMVNKFKISEVTCENLLDQKLMGHAEHKASANNLHINSSKTSLKNEFFYKSASSLISTQSNEDFGNWLSRRCTPDNQEIATFENLTSPPLGLQLKDSNVLVEASASENMDPNPTLQNFGDSNSYRISLNLERENQNSNKLVSDKNNDNLINNKNTENIKLVLKEQEIKKMPIVGGLNNRLFPLPENVNYNRSISLNGEDKKGSISSATELKVIAEIHGKVENFDQKNTTMRQAAETSSLKSSGTVVQEMDISQKNSALLEEAILSLVSVEQTFEHTNNSNEESTIIVAKTPPILTKSEDELDSQGTSVSHIANNLSVSEGEIVPKSAFQVKILTSVPKDPDSNVPAESRTGDQELKSVNSSEGIPIEKDFSRLLPIPEQIEKDQLDMSVSDFESRVFSNASVYSIFVSGPSHVDRSLKSSDSLFRKTDNSPVQKNEPLKNRYEIPSPASNGGSADNLAFDNPSHSSNLTNNNTTVDNVSFKHIAQTLSPPWSDKTAGKQQFDNFAQTSPPREEIIQTLPSNTGDILEISDDCIKLNYFNPEEMSDGEIGYVCTSNSYSSGEIKPYYQQNEDIFTELSMFQEISQCIESSTLACGEPGLVNNIISESKVIDDFCKIGMSDVDVMHTKIMESSSSKREKNQENVKGVDLLNSSNDSTSTGELKKLFSKEEKIDEGKLIDIHVHCSTWFSSESSGCSESVGSRES